MVKYKTPPFYWLIKKAFPSADIKTQIFAFYPHIYTSVDLSRDLFAHEETHLKQQKSFFGAILWWIKYWRSPKFRVKMEIEACRAQKNKAKEMVGNKEVLGLIKKMAKNLASDVYNNCISYEDAYYDISLSDGNPYSLHT